MAEEAKKEKQTRAPRATALEIAQMCRHIEKDHKVGPAKLYGQPFGKLSEIHNSFHGQDEHWRNS